MSQKERAESRASQWVQDLLAGRHCDPSYRDVLDANASAAFVAYAEHWGDLYPIENWVWPWMLLTGEDKPRGKEPWSLLLLFCMNLAADQCGWRPNPNAIKKESP